MDAGISRVLDRLGAKSAKERLKESDIPFDERMLAITEDTGRFLNILLRGRGFRNVLEVGTSTGYSALWMAEAVSHNGGRVVTIERLPSKIERAKRSFEDAGVSNIDVIEGEAEKVMSSLEGPFDFAFIDADKENVVEYYDRALELIRRGGMIAVDNALYPEKFRGMMDNLRSHIGGLDNVCTVTVPIGNGEELSVKL